MKAQVNSEDYTSLEVVAQVDMEPVTMAKAATVSTYRHAAL